MNLPPVWHYMGNKRFCQINRHNAFLEITCKPPLPLMACVSLISSAGDALGEKVGDKVGEKAFACLTVPWSSKNLHKRIFLDTI
jgi:hypothetical protein